MPSQKDINTLINTYVNFQSKAFRYEEKILIPEKKFRPPISFPLDIIFEENLTADYFWTS